ncbi:hypothetical protein F5050DRAFT_1124646 [Lentinula boryana]|uniref:Uncharacterized protein n=1 Tax=Lentinula boryana TaxID=40481 RepID=A0ABQ8PZD7_9AGAR|nr:hypothetical protein F5050DRAFT_1124646 [Lentinula boryana]
MLGMPFSSNTLSNWDGGQGLFQARYEYNTLSTTKLPAVHIKNEENISLEDGSDSLKQPLALQSRNGVRLLSSEQSIASQEDTRFQVNDTASRNHTNTEKNYRECDSDSAVASTKATEIGSLFTPPQQHSSLRTHSPTLDTISLFGATPSPQSTTRSLSPLQQQPQSMGKKQEKSEEEFDPNSYHGQGTGTNIFLSHVSRPLLPNDTTFAHYLKPHPRILDQITRYSSPSILFKDLPSPPSSRTYAQTSLKSKSRPKSHVLASSVSAQYSSLVSRDHTYTNLEDALNASTSHNAEDDYLESMADARRPLSSISHKGKREILDGARQPSSKKLKLSASSTSISSHGTGSTSLIPKQNPTTKKSLHSYRLGDIIPTEESTKDDYILLYVGTHGDYSSMGWSKAARGSYKGIHISPSTASKGKDRELHRSLVVNSNTRHIEMENNRKVGPGAKRGLPAGLNGCSIGFGIGLRDCKGKERAASSANENPGWAECMLLSIIAAETRAGLWIAHHSDEGSCRNGDQTDDEDNFLNRDLPEIHQIQAITSYPSAQSSVSIPGPPMAPEVPPPLISPASRLTSKPKTQKPGIPRFASAHPVQSPRRLSEGSSSFSPLKSLKIEKESSISSTSSATSSSKTHTTPSSSHSQSSFTVTAPTSFSLSIPTPSYSSSSMSAQTLQESYSQPEPELHHRISSLSEQALGKRKASQDSAVKPHAKHSRSVTPRASTIPATFSTTQDQHPSSTVRLGGTSDTGDILETTVSGRFTPQPVAAPSNIIPTWDHNPHPYHLPHYHRHNTSVHAPWTTATQTQIFPAPTAVVNDRLSDRIDTRYRVGEENLTAAQGGDLDSSSSWDDPNWAVEKLWELQKNKGKPIIETLEGQQRVIQVCF